jgi:hypothetical protein
MAASIFDPNSFLQTEYKGTIDTEYHNCPPGEYIAQIKKLDLRQVTFKKIEGSGVGIDIQWELLDDEVKKAMNMEQPQVRQSFLLDLIEGRNQLDLGPNRNMKLKNIIKALDLNSGKFALNQLMHGTAYVKVGQRPDDDDPEIIYSEVTRVTGLERAATRRAAE